MSTELRAVQSEQGEIALTRFSGGDRGVCVQLTRDSVTRGNLGVCTGFDRIQLSRADALAMAAALIEFATNTREEME